MATGYPGNWCETGWYASPAVADLDKDGRQEVLWGGYTGSYLAVNPAKLQAVAALTYTLVLTNPGPLLNAHVTNTLPLNASFVAGSLDVSSGGWGLTGNILTWTGAVSVTRRVTLTYIMTPSGHLTLPTAIVNAATLDDGLGRVQERRAIAVINALNAYLPLLRK